jgi:hypothetical protein
MFQAVLPFGAVLDSLSDLLGLRRSGVAAPSPVGRRTRLTFRTFEVSSVGLPESPGANLRRNPQQHRTTRNLPRKIGGNCLPAHKGRRGSKSRSNESNYLF